MACAEGREQVAQNILEVRPTGMCAVPRLFEKIHDKVIDSIEAEGGLKRKLFCWAQDVGSEETKGLEMQKEPLSPSLKAKRWMAIAWSSRSSTRGWADACGSSCLAARGWPNTSGSSSTTRGFESSKATG